MKNKQRGMTLVGFLIVLAVAGIFAFVGMKLVPMYIEFYSVKSAMKALANEPGVGDYQPERIRELFSRKLDINYSADNIKPRDIKLTRQGNSWKMEVDYEVRKQMLGNLDVVGRFSEVEILGRGGGAD